MKIKHLLFGIVFSFTTLCNGQENDNQKLRERNAYLENELGLNDSVNKLSFDFSTKRFSNTKKFSNLKSGDRFQIEVKNINLNNYRVSIFSKDTLISTTVDSFPVFDVASLGNGIGDLLSKINLSSKSTYTKTDLGKNLSYNQFMSKLMNRDEIMKYIEENENSEKIEANSDVIKTALYDLMTKEKKYLEINYDNVSSLNKKIYNINNDFSDAFLAERIEAKHLNKFKSLKIFNYDQTKDSIFAIRNKIISLSDSISKHKRSYLDITSLTKNAKTIKDNEDFKEADKNLILAYDQILKDIDTVYKNISSEKISKLENDYVDYINNSEKNYLSAEDFIDDNKVKVELKFTPIIEKSKLDTFSAKFQFPKNPISFIGLSMSFYYAGLKDEIYSTSSNKISADKTEYKLINENNKSGEMGVVTLIHLGWKPFANKFQDFGFSLVTGPALSLTKDIKPRIAVGGGMVYGIKNMFTLNVLYMGGYINKLSNAYDVNTSYSIDPSNPTISKLSGAIALSLGYIYQF